MIRAHDLIRWAAGAAVLTGAALAWWRPDSPLLAYWLVVATALGITISLARSLGGIRQRAKWLLATFALLIAVALATTQMAARRAISPTHLVYRGVHLAALDTFTIGSGDVAADVSLQKVTAAQLPWLVRVVRDERQWKVEPLGGIEQLRVGALAPGPLRRFNVANSALLHSAGDWVAVVDPTGVVVDTLRLAAGRLESSTRSAFNLRTANDAMAARYARRLRSGTALSTLEGARASPSTYERFVRVQQLSAGEVVNGIRSPRSWLPGSRRLLVSAAPPYRLTGPLLGAADLTVADSALVEVRNGDATWRFALVTQWRREPSADPGIAILFVRNPQPMDTPLPTGVSCPDGAACGAISLRRLPPPVAHIALDHAGFDPDRFGLLGTVRIANGGYQVVLPRETYQVERGRSRPVAVPVSSLAELTGQETRTAAARPTRWVLLSASGQGDYTVMILGIALGLALLLFALYRAVAAVSLRVSVPITIGHERLILVGMTAILSLLLARVTMGARVAFFDPFLPRGIETAVGLCVAIATVALGLLSWSSWFPHLMANAPGILSAQLNLRRLLGSAGRALQGIPAQAWRNAAAYPLLVAPLIVVTPNAVLFGLLVGGVVLLAWVTVAWVAAFTALHFDTFERGAHSVIEQLNPQLALPGGSFAAPATGRLHARLVRLSSTVPEVFLIFACIAVELAHLLPWFGFLCGAAALGALPLVIARRRRRTAQTVRPDYFGAAAGVAAFMVCIALLRTMSENGSAGAFVLVIFVALASVRIGRSVGSRLERSRRNRETARTGSRYLDPLLLMTPLLLLLPLALIDMGLVLVMVVPLGFATLLAVGARAAGWRLVVPAAAMVLLLLLGGRVVFPSVRAIREADSHATQAAAFADLSTVFGQRIPLLATPLDRAAARSVATRDQDLAEALLVAAGPGTARDLLIPSIEQIWGARAYASAGMFGEGLGQAVVGGRGVAETVSYAENTFSVFVLAEHGALGGLLVLGLYLLLTIAAGASVLVRASDTPSYRATRALFLVAALIVAVPALYVALSNIGLVPITGQNMPFLGLNAWSDVAICAGVVGILITGTLRGLEEVER